MRLIDALELKRSIACSSILEDGKTLVQIIDEQPAIEPEPQWTPSGKKPPKEGSYLVWMPFAPPKHRIAVAEYCGGCWNIKTLISAWMPLPEAYKGEQP